MSPRGLLAALVLPLALATACGGGDATTATDPNPTTTPSVAISPSEVLEALDPQCGDIWQAGETLPSTYRRCFEGDTAVKASSRYCEFGKPLITYADRFYAVRDGRIAEASEPFADDEGYQDVLAKCSG